MLRKIRWAALAGVGVASTFLLTACHPGSSLALVGSDTTFDVMGPLASQYNGNSSANPEGNNVFNVPPTIGTGSYTVEGDSQCGSVTYNSSNPPPNGSSAGISALVTDTGGGCVDAARSSRGRSSTDASTLQFFAFAKDAVSWAAFRNIACPGGDVAPTGCAPSNLSQDQLKGIYLCDQPGGLPRFTNWSQVGGDNEPIVRYLPQTGSGTLSFFETKILGLVSSQQGVLDDTACAVRPKRVQENSGVAVTDADRSKAILPYSYAQFTAQGNGTVPNLRDGVVLGNINGVAPTFTTISNNTFLGVRFVYNVAKTTSPSYTDVIDFIGVAPGNVGYVCSEAAVSTISQYGFVNLALASSGSGLPNSRCRKDPAPL